MGGLCSCLAPKVTKTPPPPHFSRNPSLRTSRYSNSNSSKAAQLEKQILQMYEQHMRLERSSSLRYQTSNSKQGISRSSSVRARHSNEIVLQPQQLLKNKELLLNEGIKQIILVHGGSFGAWCWYKLIALLDEAGLVVNAVDLAGSGIDSIDPNSISSLEIYVKPLVSILENLPESEKIMLVAHDFGGVCISYVMERYPQKIAKAVFITATMVTNGQRALDIFSPEVVGSDDLLQKSQVFLYGNGNSQSPTAIEFRKELLKDLLFNQSPAKDVALATMSMRPMPFAPILEKVKLTPENYGRIPRYYIETTEDCALTSAIQQNLIRINPPTKAFKLKGSDHAPFFSKPQALFKLLLEIYQIK